MFDSLRSGTLNNIILEIRNIYPFMKTKAGRYSVSTKKKKISYVNQLQQDLSPKSTRLGNLQAVWVNSQGSECKQIIGPNRCFCTHSF